MKSLDFSTNITGIGVSHELRENFLCSYRACIIADYRLSLTRMSTRSVDPGIWLSVHFAIHDFYSGKSPSTTITF